MEMPVVPPPKVCVHPRNLWVPEGSSSIGYSLDTETGKIRHTSETHTWGWRCGGCFVWIHNANPEPMKFTWLE